MTTQEFAGLGDLRVKLARLSLPTAATAAPIDPDRLRALEAGAAPDVFEIEQLAAVYGVDADALWDDSIRLDPEDGVTVLASLGEFVEVGDLTRLKMLRAANAARDLTSLRRWLDEDLSGFALSTASAKPYQEGADLAEQLRRRLGLGVRPIRSVRDLVTQHLPWIGLLYADLGSIYAPAGLSFADPHRGPAIVLNLRGKNANPLVRRFSLAHELYHLLADVQQGTPLASISGFLSENQLAREQRANGFAARLLCPESVVQRLRQVREEDAARVLIEEYGLSYPAARLYLANEAGTHLPSAVPASLSPIVEPSADVLAAEAPRGVEDFPLPAVPTERRGQLAHAASRAYVAGEIARDAFERMLDVTPAAAVESVLGYFDLDAPDPAAFAS